MAERIPQSVTKRVSFEAYLASDHVSPATGKTIAITISKNGAAFGNPSGGATNAVEIGSGSYYVDLTTTDTGTAGPLIVFGSVATVDPVKVHFAVVDAHNGGFDGVPSVASGSAGAIPTTGTGANQISVSSGQVILQAGTGTGQLDFTSGVVKANATQILGTAVSTPATAGILDVNLKNIANAAVSTSTAQLGVNAVQIGAVVPASATIGTVTTTTTATNLTNAPTNGDFTATMKTSLNNSTPAAITGAVGSVTGAVGSVTAPVVASAVTGSVGSVTGNVGGNVAGSVGSVAGNVAGSVNSVVTPPTVGGYSTGQDPATLVLDVAAASHNIANSIGAKINAAASAGDPWATSLPGAYTSGQAGNIVGNNLNAPVGSVPDAVLNRNIAGSSNGGRNVTSALRAVRNKVAVNGVTMTVYAEDDLTPAWQAALTTDSTATQITAVDPTT